MMRPQPTAVAAVRCLTQTAKSLALILPTLTASLVAASVFQSNLSVYCCGKLTSVQNCQCRPPPDFRTVDAWRGLSWSLVRRAGSAMGFSNTSELASPADQG